MGSICPMPTFLLQDLVDAEIVIVLSINHGTNQISMKCSEKSSQDNQQFGQGGVSLGRSSASSIAECMDRNTA